MFLVTRKEEWLLHVREKADCSISPTLLFFLKNVFDGLVIFCIVCDVLIFEREGCERGKVRTHAVMLVLEQT